MTRDDEIQRDLGLKLSQRLEEVLQRELDVAQCVLPTSNLAMLMLYTAAGVSMSLLSATMQMRDRGRDPGEMFDVFAASLSKMIAARKANVLDGLKLMESGQADEAIRRYGSGGGR